MTKARLLRVFQATRIVMFVSMFCAVSATPTQAQPFKTLVNFNSTDGADPDYMSLIQGYDGALYGTTYYGGTAHIGTLFSMTPSGHLTKRWDFAGFPKEGAHPYSGLVLRAEDVTILYGTTGEGGTKNLGTIFQFDGVSGVTTIYSFCEQSGCPDGFSPAGALVEGRDGRLYGTTIFGGASGNGTVFRAGVGLGLATVTTLHSFAGTAKSEGARPYAGLLLASDGNFYGTTEVGGSHGGTQGYGTVFKMTPIGTVSTLYDFDYTHGAFPYAPLIEGKDGNLYGTTTQGGTSSLGTVFRISFSGVLKVMHSFNSTDAGVYPYAPLTQASDGNFYGVTQTKGWLYRITPAGEFTPLVRYGTNASLANGGLYQHTNGTLYGTTYVGGTNGYGTIFSYDIGAGAFINLLPDDGKVGAEVEIFGNGFAPSSTVTFNTTLATHVVFVSSSTLRAFVPNGATTGPVTVTTPGGPLKSNDSFRVLPQIFSFNPSNGPVGTKVFIFGVSLDQTSKVTFGGVNATSVTVNSDQKVTAIVPTGAKTGRIRITTPGGTATSATNFTVN